MWYSWISDFWHLLMLWRINWNSCQKSVSFVTDSPTLVHESCWLIFKLSPSFIYYFSLFYFIYFLYFFNSLYCFWPFLVSFFMTLHFCVLTFYQSFLPSLPPVHPHLSFIVPICHFIFLVKSGNQRKRRKSALVRGLQMGQKSLSYFESKVIAMVVACFGKA